MHSNLCYKHVSGDFLSEIALSESRETTHYTKSSKGPCALISAPLAADNPDIRWMEREIIEAPSSN